MRFLMLSTPFPTHFTPLVPLAWGLRASGHDVLVAGQPDVVAGARSAGLCTATIGRRFHADDILRRRLRNGLRPAQFVGRPKPEMLGLAGKMWEMHARYLVHDYLDLARWWGADAVIAEQMEFSAPMVGAALGIPVISHRWGIDPLGDLVWDSAAAFLEGTCERLGVNGLPRPSVLLDPCPPSLQIPGITPGRPIRPVPFNGVGELPAFALEPPHGRRIAVCLGRQTLGLNGIPLLRNLIEGCGRVEGAETLVTVEPDYRAELGAIPDSVRLVDPTPLSGFLDSCDVLVHHGGANTTMTATAAGIAQLVVPQLMDQFAAADRVTATGIGIALDEHVDQDDPKVVHDALAELLAEQRYSSAATAMGDEVVTMPDPNTVAAWLAATVEEATA